MDDSDRFKLVEEQAGVGRLTHGQTDYTNVRYRLSRFQGMTRAGLPVPGVHRIDGQVQFAGDIDCSRLVGSSVKLRLEDGRELHVVMVDEAGRVLAEGHGPTGCTCC
jgi:hypothetical protein